jgi:PPOX class probable F420-dependent enzyme
MEPHVSEVNGDDQHIQNGLAVIEMSRQGDVRATKG